MSDGVFSLVGVANGDFGLVGVSDGVFRLVGVANGDFGFVGVANGVFGFVGVANGVFGFVSMLDDIFLGHVVVLGGILGLLFLSLLGTFRGVQSSKTLPDGLVFPREREHACLTASYSC